MLNFEPLMALSFGHGLKHIESLLYINRLILILGFLAQWFLIFFLDSNIRDYRTVNMDPCLAGLC